MESLICLMSLSIRENLLNEVRKVMSERIINEGFHLAAIGTLVTKVRVLFVFCLDLSFQFDEGRVELDKDVALQNISPPKLRFPILIQRVVLKTCRAVQHNPGRSLVVF